MTTDDHERQPLLRGEPAKPARTCSEVAAWLGSLRDNIASSWSVYRIVLLFFLYQAAYFGQVSANLQLARDLTCARYYERHPDWIDPSDPHQCSADAIERQSAGVMLAADLVSGLASAVSMLFYGKRLTTWGRKSLLVVGLLPYCLLSLMSIMIPRSYPYGPLAPDAIISPTNCVYLYISTFVLSGLLGGNALSACCFRLLVVDNSSSAERTKNLLIAQVAYMLGLTIGPLLFAALSYALPISVSRVDDVLHVFFSDISHLVHGVLSPGWEPTLFTSAMPVSPDLRAGHGNITPFLACLLCLVLAIFCVVTFVPETAKPTLASNDNDEGEQMEHRESVRLAVADLCVAATSTTVHTPAPTVSPLRALLPRRRANGKLDIRITMVLLACFFHYAGSTAAGIYILYFGHALNWGPTAIDWLISSFGITRLITIFFFVPACVVYLERTVRRPMQLSGMTVDEIHELSKGSSSDEAPVGDSAFVSEQDQHDAHLIQGAISLWRARVDRMILRLSWSFDIFGWTIVAVGAMFTETYTLLIGGAILGFGSGGLPALQSFGVAVTSDVLAADRIHDEGSANGGDHDGEASSSENEQPFHAGEVFFALLSLVESVVGTVLPVVYNLVYSSTLGTFPAASFILTAAFYSSAFIALSTIVIHRSS